MKVSQKRIEANRRNALKSTGPRTPEGKERSRSNALKHGFCSEVVRAFEDAEAVKERVKLYFNTLNPRNFFQGWIVEEIAVLTLRIDRIERIERRERDRVALRAERFWDDDRKSEAEALGRMIRVDPAGVVERLERTPHGCEWMMTRWAMLARVADRDGGWDEAQACLAFDLLGTPQVFRQGTPGETIDFDGNVDEAASAPLAVARREVARLRDRMAEVADDDALDRALAEADCSDGTSPEIRRLRRYEASLHKRLRWCMDQLQREPRHHRPHPDLRPYYDPPAPVVEPASVAESEAVANPPAPQADATIPGPEAESTRPEPVPAPETAPASAPVSASPPPVVAAAEEADSALPAFRSRVASFLPRDEDLRAEGRWRLDRRRA